LREERSKIGLGNEKQSGVRGKVNFGGKYFERTPPQVEREEKDEEVFWRDTDEAGA